MNRRRFLSTSLVTILAARLAAEAQEAPKNARITILSAGVPSLPLRQEFRRGLRELGYVENRTITVGEVSAEGKLERLPQLAVALVESKPDVIVVIGVAEALAARRATSTIPIVMVAVADPVASGLIDSLARPGNNLTGLTALPTAGLTIPRSLLLRADRTAE